LVLLPALAGCHAVNRSYSGGTGGSGGGTTTTTATTSTGTGGSGPTGNCTAVGGPFQILVPTDFGGGGLDDKPVIVADPGQGHAMVHVIVIVNAKAMNQMWVRSIVDDPTMTVVNLASFGPGFTPRAGWVTPGAQLFVQGAQGTIPGAAPGGVGQVTFPLDPFKGVLTGATFGAYPTPADCMAPNRVGGLAFTQDGMDARYVVSCTLTTMSTGPATLWIGDALGTQALAQVGAQGMSTDPAMNPDVYSFIGGTHFVTYKADMGMNSGYSFGLMASDLAKFVPLQIVSGQMGTILGAAPTVAGDGLALFAGAYGTSFVGASIWSGVAHPADYPSLGQTPPPVLKSVYTITAIDKAGGLSHPTTDANTALMAGPTLDAKSVAFDWFTRDAQPLVLQQVVYTTTTNTVIAAGAAPLGGHYVVVWIEQDSTGSSTVQGQRLLCSQT
jgi:hypothetical protein